MPVRAIQDHLIGRPLTRVVAEVPWMAAPVIRMTCSIQAAMNNGKLLPAGSNGHWWNGVTTDRVQIAGGSNPSCPGNDKFIERVKGRRTCL